MVLTECLLKLIPCDVLRVLGGITVIVLPLSSCSAKLVGGQKNSVSASSMDDIQLLIDLSKPIVFLERVFGAVEGRGPKLHELRKSGFWSAGVLATSLSVLDEGFQQPSLLSHDGNQIIHRRLRQFLLFILRFQLNFLTFLFFFDHVIFIHFLIVIVGSFVVDQLLLDFFFFLAMICACGGR